MGTKLFAPGGGGTLWFFGVSWGLLAENLWLSVGWGGGGIWGQGFQYPASRATGCLYREVENGKIVCASRSLTPRKPKETIPSYTHVLLGYPEKKKKKKKNQGDQNPLFFPRAVHFFFPNGSESHEKRDLKFPPRSNLNSVAFCSPVKSLTFSGLMEIPLVGKKLKS